MYCVAATKFTDTQLKALNVYWNMAFRIISGFQRWESVKTFMCGLERLDFKRIFVLRCSKFWKSVYISSSVVLRTIQLFCKHVRILINCFSYGVSVMCVHFSELTCVAYEHFNKSTM